MSFGRTVSARAFRAVKQNVPPRSGGTIHILLARASPVNRGNKPTIAPPTRPADSVRSHPVHSDKEHVEAASATLA
jgi:hypothetical protein